MASSSSVIDKLNREQREAATHLEGPLLVLAGAGTGKTRVITCRIAYMIEQGIDPGAILGVTFTNKAAREMRERLAKLVTPDAAHKVTLGTFHSFCGRILRREAHLAGNYNSSFTIADSSDQTSLVRQAAAELGYSKEDIPTPEAMAFIGRCKNKLITPEEALARAEELQNHSETGLAEIYARYQTLLELQNTMDFDDMLLLTLKVFREYPDVLETYRNIYRYLLVDEYQDTNTAQFQILYLLAGKQANICAVGDDDQSIYAWRGADISNILDFPKHFPGTRQIRLEQNYRSTNKILGTANAVIARNRQRYEKNLWSAKGDGENLRIVRLANGEDEARFVADAMSDLLYRNPDLSYSDCAVLYRSNYLSRVFEQEFRRRGIHPRIIGGQEFFQRKEVKDAAAYLKLILNPRDDQSLLRILSVPPRGIGDKAIETLRQLQKVTHDPLLTLLSEKDYQEKISSPARKAAEHLAGTVSAFRDLFREMGEEDGETLFSKARRYLEDVGYLNGLQKIYKDIKEAESRRENVYEFLNCIGQFERDAAARGDSPSLQDFMTGYSLMDDNDRTSGEEDDPDSPVMTTVHAAKGLEFPCVFVVGMEQNLFPHERSLLEGGEEEERRLFYVAVTRAKEYLFLTFAGERFKYGEYVRQMPSKFLKDVPDDFADKPDPETYFPEVSDAEKLAAFEEIMRSLRDD